MEYQQIRRKISKSKSFSDNADQQFVVEQMWTVAQIDAHCK